MPNLTVSADIDSFMQSANKAAAVSFLGALTTSQIAGLSTSAPSNLATAAAAGLSPFAAPIDHVHKFPTVYARTKTVGIDAATIQGCIDLITDATYSNPAQVLVPPGVYTENLTFKGCVLVAAVANNNGLSGTVRVNGTHTFVGGATAADNQLQINGLYLIGSNATTPTLSLTTASGVTSLVYIEDCYIASGSSQTTAVGVYVGPDVILRVNNVRSGAYSLAGSGGTHFDINGGSLYANGLTTEYGTCAILARGTNGALKPYCQIINSLLTCSGANVVNITSATALFTAGWSSFTNLAATGNGFSIAAGSVLGVYNSSFAIQSGASNYIATGAVGSYYYSFANNYSNAPGATYETKVDTNVTQFVYSSSTYCTGSKTFDTPSLAAGASTTTTVTCTGATTSHFAEATLSTNTGASGLTITAYVSAANTVTVRLTNQTASPVDLASGTLKVRTSL